MAKFILEPIHQRIAVSVPPKCGCTSIRYWLWEVAYGETYRKSAWIYDEFPVCDLAKGQVLPSSVVMVLAVHRSGISRMRSVYDHRIVRLKEARDQGIGHFARHLPDYAAASGSLAHHMAAQYYWLGTRPEVFTDILPLQELNRLPGLLEDVLGQTLPLLPRWHETASHSAVSQEVAQWFSHWTAIDTALGWDGKTMKMAATRKRVLPLPQRVAAADPEVRINPVVAAAPVEDQETPAAPKSEGEGHRLSAKYAGLKQWGWYLDDLAAWKNLLARESPAKVLEIGAFDGVSANLMLDELFPHPASEIHCIDPYLPDPTTPQVSEATRDLFLANVITGGHQQRVFLYEGISAEVLGWMIAGEGFWESFDFIYVDGCHHAAAVLADAVMSWNLLKPGGIIAFDDYEWNCGTEPLARPKAGIDAFSSVFGPHLTLLRGGWRRIWQKI